ncbi:hypothetical protein [uncultured Algibacter sp.]|uniref:hypothetical protein n=1 Tax=uncultured Algibacter sp. TaxID=298659 RepID=UPI00260575BD|nr:hypothetical protein [uncultured Algibacter sp.]
MKKHLTLFAILCFVFVNAQYSKGTVFFKDSTTLEGLIKIKAFGGIKFKLNKDAEATTYNHKQISGFDVISGNFRYVTNNTDDYVLLNELIKGKIILYSSQVYNPGHTIPNGFAGGGAGMTYGGGSATTYSIKVNDEIIKLGTKIKKKHHQYFNDCPVLIQKIEEKEFKKWDIYDIVEFYNEDCN